MPHVNLLSPFCITNGTSLHNHGIINTYYQIVQRGFSPPILAFSRELGARVYSLLQAVFFFTLFFYLSSSYPPFSFISFLVHQFKLIGGCYSWGGSWGLSTARSHSGCMEVCMGSCTQGSKGRLDGVVFERGGAMEKRSKRPIGMNRKRSHGVWTKKAFLYLLSILF